MDLRGSLPLEGNLRAGLGRPDDSLSAAGLQGTERLPGAQVSWEGLEEANHPDAAQTHN